MAASLSGLSALRIFLCFALGYLLSYGLRTVNAALAPELVVDLGLSAGDLGWLAAAYFVAFAAMQLPLGIWLDRYGARRVESLLLLIGAAGAALMAWGPDLLALSVGRLLIGVGVSACLMAPFAYFRRRFAPQRQPQLALWMLVAGTSGALLATAPAAALAAATDWRTVFWLAAGLLLLASAAIWFGVPSDELGSAGSSTAPGGGYASIFKDRRVWSLMPVAAVVPGGFMALQALWAGPWLTGMLGLSARDAADALFLFNGALIGGYLVMSGLSPWLERRGLLTLRGQFTLGMLLPLPVLLLIVLWRDPQAWLLWPLLALAAPMFSLAQTWMALQFPSQLAGRALTAYNLVLFVSVFVIQWGLGLLMDLLAGRVAQPMVTAFALLLALQTCAVAFYLLARPAPVVVESKTGNRRD